MKEKKIQLTLLVKQLKQSMVKKLLVIHIILDTIMHQVEQQLI